MTTRTRTLSLAMICLMLFSTTLVHAATISTFANGDSEVDVLRDWLLVSHLQIGGEPWAEVLLEKDDKIATIEIAKARGNKCERCWHYELDVGEDTIYKGLCGRCIDVIKVIS